MLRGHRVSVLQVLETVEGTTVQQRERAASGHQAVPSKTVTAVNAMLRIFYHKKRNNNICHFPPAKLE